MSKLTVEDVIVRAIIGDIPVALTIEEMEDDWEDITDEEIAEIEADYQAHKDDFPPPTPEETERFVQQGMKMVRWIFYKQEMERLGLSHLDRYEYMNMAIEPTVPEQDNE